MDLDRDNKKKYNTFYNSGIIPVQPVTIITIPKCGGIDSVILGGISTVGKEQKLCPVVTIVGEDEYDYWGWSLCLNHPEEEKGDLYHFDSSNVGAFRGAEFPNLFWCFIAKVEFCLTSVSASLKEIDDVLAFALPQIKTMGKTWNSLTKKMEN